VGLERGDGAVHERLDQFWVSAHRLGARMAEGQEDRERRCGGGLTGGVCLRVVDGEPHLLQPPGRREPAEISSAEAGQAPDGPPVAEVAAGAD